MWMGWTRIEESQFYAYFWDGQPVRSLAKYLVMNKYKLIWMINRELRTGVITVVRWDEGNAERWSDVSVTDSSAPRWVYMMLYQISARWLVSWWVRRSDCLVCWFQWYCDIGLIWHFIELFWVFDISDLRNVERTWPVNSKEWNFEAEFYRCGLKIWMLLELFSLLFREHV